MFLVVQSSPQSILAFSSTQKGTTSLFPLLLGPNQPVIEFLSLWIHLYWTALTKRVVEDMNTKYVDYSRRLLQDFKKKMFCE